jgi:hypothetical protein
MAKMHAFAKRWLQIKEQVNLGVACGWLCFCLKLLVYEAFSLPAYEAFKSSLKKARPYVSRQKTR